MVLPGALLAPRVSPTPIVLLGNVREAADAGKMLCPGCKQAIIGRDIFAVTSLNIVRG